MSNKPMGLLSQDAFRYAVRYLIQIPSVYRPTGEPDFLLFSTRRSGSTLLRDAFHTLPRTNYIDQPFNSRQFNPHRGQWSIPDLGQITSATPEEKIRLRTYVEDLLARRRVLRSQWQIWTPSYSWVWSRYVVKIHNAKPLMPWFEETFGHRATMIYATRHPIPASLSLIRQGWALTASTYLQDTAFCDTHLSGSTIDFCQKILAEGSPLERNVVNWCLENIVPIRLWERSNWFTISYERLVGDPEGSARRITRLAGGGDESLILSVISRPTRTAYLGSKGMINRLGPESRLSAWRGEVSRDEIALASRILEVFEIDLYRADVIDPLPAFDDKN